MQDMSEEGITMENGLPVLLKWVAFQPDAVTDISSPNAKQEIMFHLIIL